MQKPAAFSPAVAVTLALVLLAPLALYPVFLATVLCFALFACAFNLVFGFTNLLSFGHAAFFGWSGYVCGYALAGAGWPLPIALLAAVAVSALLGFVVGTLSVRQEGIYFAMVTLALSQMLYFFAERLPFTGGENGLQGVPRGDLFGMSLTNDLVMYYVVAAVCVLGFAATARIINSPFGEILHAIKDNESRALSLGYRVNRFKVIAFTLSATLAGLAGALKCVVLGFTTLNDVHWSTSGVVLLMVLIGGRGTFLGPAVGAALIVSLDTQLSNIGAFLAAQTGIDWFNQLGRSVTMVTGLIFIVCVLTLRGGLAGSIRLRKRRDRQVEGTDGTGRRTTSPPAADAR